MRFQDQLLSYALGRLSFAVDNSRKAPFSVGIPVQRPKLSKVHHQVPQLVLWMWFGGVNACKPADSKPPFFFLREAEIKEEVQGGGA